MLGKIDGDLGGEFLFGVEFGFFSGALSDVDPTALENFVGAFSDGGADFDEAVIVCFFTEAEEGVFGDGVDGGLVIEFEDSTIGA
ncbi:MAG: hypothetical protein QNL39_09900 [Akkermansiaceae bacterium]